MEFGLRSLNRSSASRKSNESKYNLESASAERVLVCPAGSQHSVSNHNPFQVLQPGRSGAWSCKALGDDSNLGRVAGQVPNQQIPAPGSPYRGGPLTNLTR